MYISVRSVIVYSIFSVIVSSELNSSESKEAVLQDNSLRKKPSNEKILSRKKRYLTFPDGSSLQLIYCLTIPVLYEIDYAYGYTVSLAWQLPSDTRMFLKNLPSPRYDVIHRRDRRELYSKLETFLQAHGMEGRSCVLKGLCESGQRPKEKGEFLEEFLYAIFSLPETDEQESGLPSHYDEAFKSNQNCTELYPDCPTSLFALAMSH